MICDITNYDDDDDDDDGSAYCDPLSPEVTGILSDLPPTPPTLHILSLPYSFPKLNTYIFFSLFLLCKLHYVLNKEQNIWAF